MLAEYLRGIVWPEDDIELALLAGALYVGHGAMEYVWEMPAHLVDFTTDFDNGVYPVLSIMDSWTEE